MELMCSLSPRPCYTKRARRRSDVVEAYYLKIVDYVLQWVFHYLYLHWCLYWVIHLYLGDY